MITDALVDWFFGISLSILQTLPETEVPTWVDGASTMLDTVTTYAGQMGAWFPSQLLVNVQLAILATWAIAFLIKVIRMVVSLFTAGGGSAA